MVKLTDVIQVLDTVRERRKCRPLVTFPQSQCFEEGDDDLLYRRKGGFRWVSGSLIVEFDINLLWITN